MATASNTLATADDQYLVQFIRQSTHHLVVIAPGLRAAIAEAVADQWQALGAANVAVTLDTDPEVIRLGIGELSSLDLLERTAQRMGTALWRQPGLRIGIIVADDETVVFSPGPRFAAMEGTPARKNALLLAGAAFRLVAVDASDQPESPQRDLTQIKPASIAALKQELVKNPAPAPAAPEVLERFNGFCEFVELKLEGTAIERKTVPISTELLGLANSEDLRQRMRANFRLVGDEDRLQLSGRGLEDIKKQIASRYLKPLKGYGTVVLRLEKKEFEAEVRKLQTEVDEFKKEVEKSLQAAIDRNRKDLMAALLPSVKTNRPIRWKRLNDEIVGRLLDEELQKAFGTARHLVGEMKVKCIFKGVTYELLSDAHFLGVAAQAIPNFPKLHRAFDAVEVGGATRDKVP